MDHGRVCLSEPRYSRHIFNGLWPNLEDSYFFFTLSCYFAFLQSPNISLTTYAASDHPEIIRGEVKRTGDWEPDNWILLLAQLVLTSVKLIKLPGISVLICQRHRMDCKSQCSVRNVQLIWPIGHWYLSWEVSKLDASNMHVLPQISGGGSCSPTPELFPFLRPILYVHHTVTK